MESHPLLNSTLIAIDGPRDNPNGRLMVKVIAAAEQDGFYWCDVQHVIFHRGRHSKVGDRIKIHRHSFES